MRLRERFNRWLDDITDNEAVGIAIVWAVAMLAVIMALFKANDR
jgi:hypothetical protein